MNEDNNAGETFLTAKIYKRRPILPITAIMIEEAKIGSDMTFEYGTIQIQEVSDKF